MGSNVWIWGVVWRVVVFRVESVLMVCPPLRILAVCQEIEPVLTDVFEHVGFRAHDRFCFFAGMIESHDMSSLGFFSGLSGERICPDRCFRACELSGSRSTVHHFCSFLSSYYNSFSVLELIFLTYTLIILNRQSIVKHFFQKKLILLISYLILLI
jgi:hypothetical protein